MFKWKRVRRGSILDNIPERNSEVIWRNMKSIELSVVALNMSSGLYFVFRNVEARIWQFCDGQRTIRQIIDAVREEFPRASKGKAVGFISKLTEDGLVFW